MGASFPKLKHLTLETIASTEPANRSFAEQVIDNPLELDRIAAALKNRTVQRKPFKLELKALGVDSAGIKALAAQPVLSSISGLSFIFSALSDEDVAILAALDRPFKSFELHLGKIGFAGAVALSQSAWLTMLSELILPNQDIGDVGIAAVIGNLDGGKIEMLRLRHNQLGDNVGDRAVLQLFNADLRSLQRLKLVGVSDEAISKLESPERYVTNRIFG